MNSVAFINSLPHSGAILDDRHLIAGSHHQKVLIVRRGNQLLVAWTGGVDINPDRLHEKGVNGSFATGSPLFDVQVRIEGAGAVDLLETFVDRWSRHPASSFVRVSAGERLNRTRRGNDGTSQRANLAHLRARLPVPSSGPVRQSGPGERSAQHPAARVHDMPVLRRIDPLRDALRVALRAADFVVVVMAPLEAVDDLPDIAFRRHEFVAPLMAEFPGKLLAFEALGTAGTPTSPEAYVHSKLLLVDDEVACVGTLNYSRRSWTHDSEVMTPPSSPSGHVLPVADASALQMPLAHRAVG